MLKFAQTDARNILERASARETAIRVAAGEIYRQYLSCLGVEIGGYVCEVCGINDGSMYEFNDLSSSKSTDLGMLNKEIETRAKAKVDALAKVGDTAGGMVEIRVKGLKSGFGGMMTYAEKLDGQLAQGLMSIQAAKAVEIGAGVLVAQNSGREIHDEIFYEEEKGYYRKTNHAGGIEGGMSNGEEIVVRVAMKPIPTLMSGLRTVDFITKEACVAATERSDVCAIFAFERIAEAVVAEVIANAVSNRLGGDTMDEVKLRYEALR
jgi:chorismate synthase